MGYDMSIKGTIAATDPVKVEQAKQDYGAAADEHRARMDADRAAGTFTWDRHSESEKELNELYGRYCSLAYPREFRLNIFAMGRYRGAMLELGMIHESASPTTAAEWAELPEWEDDNEDAYNEARDKLSGRHGIGPEPTIPSHKLCSNDGWLVTPHEIRAALEAWDGDSADRSSATGELIETEYWNQWIAYLRLAVENEGFRVH